MEEERVVMVGGGAESHCLLPERPVETVLLRWQWLYAVLVHHDRRAYRPMQQDQILCGSRVPAGILGGRSDLDDRALSGLPCFDGFYHVAARLGCPVFARLDHAARCEQTRGHVRLHDDDVVVTLGWMEPGVGLLPCGFTAAKNQRADRERRKAYRSHDAPLSAGEILSVRPLPADGHITQSASRRATSREANSRIRLMCSQSAAARGSQRVPRASFRAERRSCAHCGDLLRFTLDSPSDVTTKILETPRLALREAALRPLHSSRQGRSALPGDRVGIELPDRDDPANCLLSGRLWRGR